MLLCRIRRLRRSPGTRAASELRERGHTYLEIANILNEETWVPVKGRKFTYTSIGKLLRGCDETKHQTPKRYLESMLVKMNREHTQAAPCEPFQRPGLPKLATLIGQLVT